MVHDGLVVDLVFQEKGVCGVSEQIFCLGHRQRLRERFLKGGEDALAAYEIIEMFLFSVNPRKDMKPLAKRLLAKFGSVTNVLNADEAELLSVEGMGRTALATLKLIQVTGQRQHREIAMNQRVTEISTWRHVLNYCEVSMAHLKREQLRLFFLDKQYKLIGEEIQMLGTVDHAPVYVREIVNKAVNVGATGLVLVHNHPSGDPTPSGSDIEATRQIKDTAERMGITLYDHIIIGKGKHTSLKHQGLI